MKHLTLDLSGFSASAIAGAGISDSDLDRIAPRARDAFAEAMACWKRGDVGFWDLPDDHGAVADAKAAAARLPAEVDTLVVLGIGGSSLGPHALWSALVPPFGERGAGRRLLFPDNSDPATMAALLASCPPERTAYNVVTKSGGTAETAAQLLIVERHLVAAVGEEGARARLLATTDPERGGLRALAGERGWATLPIPANVGGRFSVLSAVGLYPAAVAGLDIAGLLDGARAVRDDIVAAGDDLRKNPALALAALLHWQNAEAGRPLVVVMPYADALYDCADWFRQLWGESLGKRSDIAPTPIASRMATDQHSQLQLYTEGPDDKSYLVLAPAKRPALVMPGDGPVAARPEYGYLANRQLGELIDAELRGTVASLGARQRPVATLLLDEVSSPAVGALLFLFEAAAAFAGPLYGVNPYDQPGVEEAKRLAFGALGRPGFEAEAEKLAVRPRPGGLIF